MIFVIRSRWENRGDGHSDSFQHSWGVASMGGDIFAHFLHDDHSFSNLKSFGLTVVLVWGIGRRGCGVIFRRRDAFPDVVG